MLIEVIYLIAYLSMVISVTSVVQSFCERGNAFFALDQQQHMKIRIARNNIFDPPLELKNIKLNKILSILTLLNKNMLVNTSICRIHDEIQDKTYIKWEKYRKTNKNIRNTTSACR